MMQPHRYLVQARLHALGDLQITFHYSENFRFLIIERKADFKWMTKVSNALSLFKNKCFRELAALFKFGIGQPRVSRTYMNEVIWIRIVVECHVWKKNVREYSMTESYEYDGENLIKYLIYFRYYKMFTLASNFDHGKWKKWDLFVKLGKLMQFTLGKVFY